MTPERIEEVRRWYHANLPGGMGGDWLAYAEHLELAGFLRTAAFYRDCASIYMYGPGLHDPRFGDCRLCGSQLPSNMVRVKL